MQWAWLIPVFSFAAAPIIVLIGDRLPGKGAVLSIAAIAAGFVFFWIALFGWMGATEGTEHCYVAIGTEALTCNYERTWFNAGLPGLDGSVALTWGFFVDPVTIAMLGLGDLRGPDGADLLPGLYARRPAHQLVLRRSRAVRRLDADHHPVRQLPAALRGWELVGVCSYLLIGFWHERPSAREAAKKAFIVTRIGDVGLLIGILLLWREVGTFSMTDAFAAVQDGTLSEGVTIAAALLLFMGAMGKSAQIPFHVWLPDAMEGPTPVSALIHAATMVVAGVFLVARAFPLFEAYDAVPLMVVAIVGLVTALVTSTIALVATDIKRILAYSTVSHLGLMMLSLGAFGYTAAIFHLLAHGVRQGAAVPGGGQRDSQHGEAGDFRAGRPAPGDADYHYRFRHRSGVAGRHSHPGRILEQGRDIAGGLPRTQPGVHRVRADNGVAERAVHGAGAVRDLLRAAASANWNTPMSRRR